jgi:hypothetical protein
MLFTDLIGKTIASVKVKKLADKDDQGFLEMQFSDGSQIIIIAGYGGYTGKSEDEYPTYIIVQNKYSKSLVDLPEGQVRLPG